MHFWWVLLELFNILLAWVGPSDWHQASITGYSSACVWGTPMVRGLFFSLGSDLSAKPSTFTLGQLVREESGKTSRRFWNLGWTQVGPTDPNVRGPGEVGKRPPNELSLCQKPNFTLKIRFRWIHLKKKILWAAYWACKVHDYMRLSMRTSVLSRYRPNPWPFAVIVDQSKVSQDDAPYLSVVWMDPFKIEWG